MAQIHAATYTNHDGIVANLNDHSVTRFANGGLPSNLYTPVFSSVDVVVPAMLPAALNQGYDYGMRDIAMRVWFAGTPDVILGHVAYLVDLFWSDIRDGERGVFTYTAANLVTRAIACSIANLDALRDWLGRWQGVETRVQLPIVLRCQDPTFYDPTAVDGSGAFNDGTDVDISLANPGNTDAYPTITYTGAVESPKATDVYGHIWEIELDMSAGDVLEMVLDPHEFAVTYTPNAGSPVSRANLQSGESQLVVVPHGTNDLTFVSGDGTPSGSATIAVAFNPRYAAHGR